MINEFINRIKYTLTEKAETEKQLEFLMSLEGQISKSEAAKLVELAASVPTGLSIVEIGTYRGRSAIALAYGSLSGNKNRVFAVDPHEEFTGVMGGVFGPHDQKELYANIVRAGVGEIVAVVSLPSAVVSRAWVDKNIGLLWIDGDHSYDGVFSDYSRWRPLVADDGVIAFHDSDCDGVARLIREIKCDSTCRVIDKLESITCFKVDKGL